MKKITFFLGLMLSTTIISSNSLLAFPTTSINDPSNSMQNKSEKCVGTVVDVKGVPVIGAQVIVKGTSNGASTDLDGQFVIPNVKRGSTLVVKFVGYKSQEIKWDGQPLNIILQEDTKLLDEVVIIGFGTQKKANLTGAVTTIKMDEAMGDRPLVNVTDALQGNVPGLFISGGNVPGAGKGLQLRGATTIGSGAASSIPPLVLIDNVEGSLDMLNPNDIESVTLLKDAASAAIYGARAAGGVLLITTKRPKKGSSFNFNYTTDVAFSNAINLPRQAPLMQYLKTYKELGFDAYWSYNTPKIDDWISYLEQYQKDPNSLDVKGDGIYKDPSGAVYFLNDKDLFKEMLETGFQQKHNLSMSGSTDRIRYRLSGGFVTNDGVLIQNKDKFERVNISSYVGADITKWYTQEATMSYSHRHSSLPSSTVGIYSLRLPSFYPSGHMPEDIVDDKSVAGLPFFTSSNQIKWSNPSNNNIDNPRIFLKSTIKPFSGFSVALEYTYDKRIYHNKWYSGSVHHTTIQGDNSKTPDNDHLDITRGSRDYYGLNIYGSYEFDLFKDHSFKIMAGFNQEETNYADLTGQSFDQAYITVPALSSGTGKIIARDGYSDYAVRGGFFRVNYNFKDRYLLEVNGRYDGSSKFPKKNRFGFFPSVSAGWNVTNEGFMQDVKKYMNLFKIRASYGTIGNQSIAPYTFYPTMGINNKFTGWLVDGTFVTSITNAPGLVSDTFTWEKVTTTNIGLDMSFLNNRITSVFEMFQRDTKGMLAPGVKLPAVIGASAPRQNTADMRTRGWEFSINYKDSFGDFRYHVGFNLSDNHSWITKYDSNPSKQFSSFYKGQRIGDIWGYVNDGFYTVDDFVDTKNWQLKDGVTRIQGINPRPGDFKFRNLRDDDQGENLIYGGNDTYDNPGDRKVIGNTTPRYLYGINLGVGYKGFDLNIFLQGVGSRQVWLANVLTMPLYNDYRFIPLYEGLDNYWKPVQDGVDYNQANPEAEFARIYGSYGNINSNYRVQDKFLSDASYLRIKNVTLSYVIPKDWCKAIHLTGLRAFVGVENLFTFSKLRQGIDPETTSWNYPAYRTVTLGLNVTL